MDVHRVLADAYKASLVEVAALTTGIATPTLDAEMLNHTNGMKLFVCGNDMHGQAGLSLYSTISGKAHRVPRYRTSTSCSDCPKPRGSSNVSSRRVCGG